MAVKVFYPPEIITGSADVSVFLAGTIDMGDSYNWQEEVIDYIKGEYEQDGRTIYVYNPRRKDWDSSWRPSLDDPEFYQQVRWELDCMDKSTFVVFNFLENSKSPVTMLELGHIGGTGKAMVCCPKEFYRSGNVHIYCNRENIPLYLDLESLLNDLLYV